MLNNLDAIFELDDEYSLGLVDDYVTNLRRRDPRGDLVHTLGLRPDQCARLYTVIDSAIISENYDRAVRTDIIRALRQVRKTGRYPHLPPPLEHQESK